MNDIFERIARMSPERRKVLEKLLRKEGINLPDSPLHDSKAQPPAESSSYEKDNRQLYDSLIKEQSESLLVRIQPCGDRLPFFFIHPVGGSVFCYTELARQMGKERPVYGIKASGLAPGTEPLTHLRNMTEQYTRIIRDICPSGPYLLGGVSAGGNIAYEIARDIRGQGEDVRLLTLIDTFSFYDYLVDDDVDYFLAFSLSFGLFFNTDPLTSYYDVLNISPDEGIDAIYRNIRTLSHAERLDILRMCMSEAGITGADISADYLDRYFRVYVANCRALIDYTPDAYSGKVILFRATTDDPLALKLGDPDHRLTDSTLGWNSYASDIEVYDIPGSNHYNILTLPYVSMVAKKLKQILGKCDNMN
ncbi:MAG: hypothetical protein GY749_35635 [Desulfobacteraceae bacterium]|nr:hypothetical protein [Desulfobacteraceae bacterium]